MKALIFILSICFSSLYATGQIDIQFESFELDNGLKVYLSQDTESPLVAVTLHYKVGSVDEEKGKTGFAHLFEHMMFQGTRNIDKAEHFKLLQKVGGSVNAFTTREYTAYYDLIPSNQLKLALWLEADRMKNLSVNYTNFNNQLEVVKEEMRMRYLNSPYGKLFKTVSENAHSSWNYQHPPIGTIEDLNSSGVEYAREFFKKYYNPNNAVLTIVGDIDLKETKALVKTYFGKIKNKAKPPKIKLEEGKKVNKKAILKDKLAKFPAIALVYKAPSLIETKDYFSMKMLEAILFNNASSRLYRKLVKEKELAISLYGGIDSLKHDNLFYIFSIVKPGTEKKVKSAIFKEINQLLKKGVTKQELEKAKLNFKTEFVFKLQSIHAKSLMIGEYAIHYGDPKVINELLSIIDSITLKDVKNIGKKFLKKEFLSEVDVVLTRGK